MRPVSMYAEPSLQAMMASASGACAQDSKLTVPNVTVAAPAPPAPVAPPYVQSLYGRYRVEEDKFGEVPCSQTRIAFGPTARCVFMASGGCV